MVSEREGGGTPFRLLYAAKAERQLRSIGEQEQSRIKAGVERLANWPDHRADVLMIKAARRGLFRLRIGNWRIIFRPDTERRVIVIFEILPRTRAYSR